MCRGQWAGALPARLSIDLVALHSQWFCLLPFLILQPSGLTSVPQAHLPLFDIKHTCCSDPARSLASRGCPSGRRADLTWSGGPTCITEGPTSVLNVGTHSKGHLCSLSPPPVEGTKDDPRAQAGIKPSLERSFPIDLSRPAWSTPLRPSCLCTNPAWVFLWSVAPAALLGEQGDEVLPLGRCAAIPASAKLLGREAVLWRVAISWADSWQDWPAHSGLLDLAIHTVTIYPHWESLAQSSKLPVDVFAQGSTLRISELLGQRCGLSRSV